ncbi:ABC transporter permease [Microbacterium sp. NPDC055910]|uniref:ABC transporter permease n=1 Tax=Microbacterium sp. NPDC055910 TaxID=3345659 RepID=UPI0035D9E1FD
MSVSEPSTSTDPASPSPATVAQRTVPSDGGSGDSRFRRVMSKIPGPLVGLVVIFVLLSFLSPYFLTSRNLLNILTQISAIGVMSVGALMVIIVAGIDLSVGAVLALSSMVMAYLYSYSGLPFELAVVLGLATGAGIGLLNGILITYGRLQPFIATLATMSAATGLAVFITGGNTVNGFPSWFTAITRMSVLGIPIQGIILVAVFLIAAFWLRFRPGGRALYAIGGNEEVARLSGIHVRRTKLVVYTLAGFLAAVAGLLVTSRLDSAQPTAGTADLLNVIAVVVIGGASLAGGTGSVLGTFVGLLIIGVLNNGMSLLGVSPNLQPVVLGAVIVAAVMTDRQSSKAQSGGR